MEKRKQQVQDLLGAIETGAHEPVGVIDAGQYTQHNLGVADGLAGFGALLAQLPKGTARVDTRRVFADGDYVFTHTDYDFFGPKIGFDVFRFAGDKIVEHWDNLQEKPSRRNPSGHTMIDGPTEPRDLDKTAANKQLVARFLDEVLVNGNLDALPRYIDDARYTQHNPHIGDGLSGLGAALAAMAQQGLTMQYDRVHRVLGEGDFVLAMSEGRFGGKLVAFYDLFRLEDDKLVEHWDTIEPIPPRAAHQHGNGKF